jgi:hypothetical protein
MTTDERAEWLGDPLTVPGANLFATGPYYSGSVNTEYHNGKIIASATAAGTYLYSVCVLGNAESFAHKTLTLSVDSLTATNGATPQIALYWHDTTASGADVYAYAGASISAAQSVTFNTADFPNTEKRYLAAYIYVTTHGEVVAGATATFEGVMLTIGDEKHPFVPYTAVVANETTKGAYNYSDLNRVEQAVSDISDIAGLGLTTKTNWTMWDIPRAADMTRYLDNIYRIRYHYGLAIDLPASMNDLTYIYANNIERVLLRAYEIATS